MHRGCTSAGTDACIYSTVRARVKHVTDRRRTVREAKEGSVVWRRGGGEGIERKNNSPRRTVITEG